MTSTADRSCVSGQLRAALEKLGDGLPPSRAAAAVQRLSAGYRGRTPGPAPALRGREDAVAYAAYRMPATFAAVSAALREVAARLPGWAPSTHVDVGGGTGAAGWAAAGVWPAAERTNPRTLVLDRAQAALDLGRELAEWAADPALRHARWQRHNISGAGAPELPEADLVTLAYVLGELPDADRAAAVAAAARAGRAVVLVEPGTPAGYLRIRAARDHLLAAGLRLLAPCPHHGACPIVAGTDWCHFGARVGRSSLHRRVKGGVLPYEDEKFSYVAAVRDATAAPAPAPVAGRIVRRPQLRKGQVLLHLCTADGELDHETVSKRRGAEYRAARDIPWGSPWPLP